VIYIWRSEALKQYGQGWLITTASSVDDARAKARNAAYDWLRSSEGYDYWFLANGALDEFFIDDHKRFWVLLTLDLKAEPERRQSQIIRGTS
jgi:hypothetical protein